MVWSHVLGSWTHVNILMKGRSSKIQRNNCFQCKYFYITWDKRFPYGCRVYGIKTRYNPSAEVFKATGKGCLGYKEKQKSKR